MAGRVSEVPGQGRRLWMWWVGVVLAFVVAALALALLLTPKAARVARASIPVPPGWTLRFGDDFDGPAGNPPSSRHWRIDIGQGYPDGPPNWGTREVESYTSEAENIGLDGKGHLLITPRRDVHGNWTSARIETNQDDFKAPAGGVLRIEARIQMPNVTGGAALGYWPAFWALGSDFRRLRNWPQTGEFDIMENVNGLNTVWGILHCGVYPAGPCHEPSGIGTKSVCPGASCQGAFHVYTFEWDRSMHPEQLRWYVDGKLYNTVSEAQVPASTWHDMTAHRGYFLLLNVAMGGGFADTLAALPTPTTATQPDHPMVVDYVAVWSRSGGLLQPFPAARSP